MKNFEWNNEENNVDYNDQNMNTRDGGPDGPSDEELAKQLLITWIVEKIYMGLAWVQLFLCIYAAFAWLWQTQWAPFATFLVFLVAALEKTLAVASLTVNPSVQAEKITYDDDDDNNSGRPA